MTRPGTRALSSRMMTATCASHRTDETARTLRGERGPSHVLWDPIRAQLPQDSLQQDGVGVAMGFRLTLATLRRSRNDSGNDQPVGMGADGLGRVLAVIDERPPFIGLGCPSPESATP